MRYETYLVLYEFLVILRVIIVTSIGVCDLVKNS